MNFYNTDYPFIDYPIQWLFWDSQPAEAQLAALNSLILLFNLEPYQMYHC